MMHKHRYRIGFPTNMNLSTTWPSSSTHGPTLPFTCRRCGHFAFVSKRYIRDLLKEPSAQDAQSGFAKGQETPRVQDPVPAEGSEISTPENGGERSAS